MSDSPWTANNKEADPRKLPSIDFRGQILGAGPAIDADPSRLHAEPGPPPTIQPNSNYDRFPDTQGRKPWWPVDTTPIQPGPNRPLSREDRPGGWGVHWADPPPVILRWPTPDNPPGPVGPVPDGPIFKPDPIQPPRLDDDAARNSVNIDADARLIYLTAGATGAGIGTGVHFADLYTGAIEPTQRTGAVAFWRNNLSPSQALVPKRAAALQAIEEALPDLRTAANAAARTLDRQVQFRTQLADSLLAQIPTTPLPPPELDWYNARVDLVRNDLKFTPANIMANAGTQDQVDLRQRLFTQADAEPIATQATDFWQDTALSKQAQATLASKEAARNSANQLLTQAERGSITTGTEAFLRGAGQGLAVASAAVASDYLLDRALGNSPLLSNQAHWGVQGIGVPLLLLSNTTPITKVLGSVAMVGISHTMDQYLGPPTGIFSAFSRPSLPEIGLATAGALIPVRDIRLRAGLAVGGWLLGKAWNCLDDRFEITGKSEPRLRDAASAAVDLDLKSPSIEHFNFAVDQMRKFSDKNDAASAVLVRDWQSTTNAKTSIEKERGSAALLLGFGESMLARGSRIDQNKWSEKGDRLLAGLDYDLGGQATSYLRAAAGNLQEALKLAKQNKGAQLSSGTIDDAYINELDYEKSHADQVLEKVYGLHDISKVYYGVKEQVDLHESEMKVFAENLAQYAKTVSDNEPRFKAKISRDLAIIHIAFAELDTTAGGKTEHFRNALRYVDEASRLDPGAADRAQLLNLLNSKQ